MDKTQGRRVCDILKEIRKKFANEGNLELNQKECNYKGECSGTCPACEAELKKINDKFDHKKLLSLAGCATMILPLTACTSNTMDNIQGNIEYREGPYIADDSELTKDDLPDDLISGKIEPKKKNKILAEEMQGEIPIEEVKTQELQGDIAIEPSTVEEPEVVTPNSLEPTQGVLPLDEYVFTEEEDECPKGVTTLKDLEVSEKLKNMIKNDFPKNHLRGVINPNAKFH